MTIEALRTPDDRFDDLPGYTFEPHYADQLVDGLRLHYLDEGPADAEHTFFCLHGEPTWSYLYRKMIPIFTAAGHRVVAPDFFGFGRSDKPIDDAVYTFDFHRDTLLRLLERLALHNITLVCQDWGGTLGLTLPMDMPERFGRLIVMNTVLTTGQLAVSEGFLDWQNFVASKPDFDIGNLMARAVPGISEKERAAYMAPFPDSRYRAGVRRFPAIMPMKPEDNGADISRRAAEWFSSQWDGRAFMAIGLDDPVLGKSVMEKLYAHIRGCPPPLELVGVGHFVQESGQQVAKAALAAFA
ncbi:MAG: haloalkane dehalogenase [Proteobacteria bacterium]|nr:haloalkane dehalogenase [Pseudomonadota bacterium]